jgi:glycosyltransferase involved in cell wall biosynthesis
LTPPRVSVVIPARNCPEQLEFCLGRLAGSECTDYELIVADDASTDGTAALAEELGATVVRLEKQSGPAGARNRGAQIATGEILYFIDADTGVHPGNVGAVIEAFDADPDLDALFGSYDTNPTERNLISQYRNLMHHFVHQQGSEEATTFWSGCGAIKRELFLEHGGFDPGLYGRPSIEDIELGARLVRAGHRIRVVKHLQVTHLKRWTLWNTIRTDVFDRGIPWTRLILREKNMPDDLNVGVAQRVSLILAYLGLMTFFVGAWYQPWLLVVPPVMVLALLGYDRWTLALGITPGGQMLVTAAMVALLAGLTWLAPYWMAASLVLVLLIALLNYRFYAFFLRERGAFFAIAVLPLHTLYFLYSGVAFGLGVLGHLFGGKQAAATDGGARS